MTEQNLPRGRPHDPEAGATGETGVPADFELRDELAQAQERVAQFEDRWRRAVADADNQRKRQVRELDRQRAEVAASLAARWLPVVDNLDRAVAHAQAAQSSHAQGSHAQGSHAQAAQGSHAQGSHGAQVGEQDSLLEGVRAVLEQAVGVLAGLGFPRQDEEVGAVFDPARHEAVASVPSAEVPAGTVLDVVRPGYGEGERQLRPAGVVVATKAA
ncbi:nucleotide exchange factor GrpE [Actinopolymorpha singaporensis]|uniref:Protein GrpE n=1 Tax=Actinopolymorpha singaporensis TaxID=117157 RepID=A0A1H1YLK8_9ACTN|nr:nucleotide exchange factor GrpE [Actinopolymorpha singaporensis]SDT22290.1 molecular chaperone GrpE [Actinopolymorpha singaporensis]